jgi:hypothetical protein
MFASQVAEYGEQAIAFSAIGFFKRPRAVRQFGRRGPRLDEAMSGYRRHHLQHHHPGHHGARAARHAHRHRLTYASRAIGRALHRRSRFTQLAALYVRNTRKREFRCHHGDCRGWL